MALATLGIVVPSVAAFYEFVLKGRKRLGYRIQMDTTTTNVAETDAELPGALLELQNHGVPLRHASLVLLRVENNGFTYIDTHDYVALDDDRVGIRFFFPNRKVVGTVITELSNDSLRANFRDLRTSFREETDRRPAGGVIELPKVPMNRNAHYKVLAALERVAGVTGEPAPPTLEGEIKDGRIQETQSRTNTPKRVITLVGFLVLLIVAQLVVFLRGNSGAPLDCTTGHLAVYGSTAFEPIVAEAAGAYRDLCPGASFAFTMEGSGEGVAALDDRVRAHDKGEFIAFSDGRKAAGMPGLTGRPISFFLFALVANPDAGVRDLTLSQVRDIYAGKVANWAAVGGNDLPIRLITRHRGSGTRAAFKERVLGTTAEAPPTVDVCPHDSGRQPFVCEVGDTGKLLTTVAGTSGALGYGEAGAAAATEGVRTVRIDDHPPTVEAADAHLYPFWETEYAYTGGEPAARSLSASFLRFLTTQTGADILRAHGLRPCAELADPARCQPA
ncbi:substrate-binding domain-containing protein [Actinoplanes oblitus]|uniref:Substrate-binding domain-containing protein n=1 Tax=Actinoplanes oblitus TaxID=3040509 RepID=A0ABY8WL41_9ACTN|nr:substrate-binding domain-containing protein [Actinoplanes oblitus]WIM98363.1 substrate-binding domain-containing protein [Actinoplanes oblitus]